MHHPAPSCPFLWILPKIHNSGSIFDKKVNTVAGLTGLAGTSLCFKKNTLKINSFL